MYISKEQKEDLNKELENLVKVERPKVLEALNDARALGDLSENAEYHEARANQARLEGRIEEINNILKEAGDH